MSSLQKIICLLLVLVICLNGQPMFPIWGGNLQYSVNVSFIYDKPVMKWNFTYFYNWNVKAERYQHHAPQADQMCLLANPPFTINDSCAVTFATDGWSYIQYPAHNWCCKCENQFGAIRSDWLRNQSNYIGTQLLDGMRVTHWTKNGQYLNHYYSTVDRALPVRFNQIKKGNLKQWDFDLKSYNDGPFDPSKLQPKCQNLCGGECRFFRKKTQLQTQE